MQGLSLNRNQRRRGKMSLIDKITQPWSIIPCQLEQIQVILSQHLAGPKIGLKEIEARILSFDDLKSRPYGVINGKAVIPVKGTLMKNSDIFSRIFFGSGSMSQIKDDFKAALADDGVKEIILHVDSPGGTVDGAADLANTIYNARGKKPITAFSDGVIASAAYWIGSAADKVLIANDTTTVGSIGVISTHVDETKALENKGLKVTQFVAGKYKNAGSSVKALTEENSAYLQDRVDYLYSGFVDGVAKHRGVSAETVLSDMADGRLFTGKQAIKAGLVDGVSTLDALIGSGESNTNQINTEGNNMAITIDMVKADADLYKSICAEIEKEAFAKGFDAGQKAEVERIQNVKAQVMPGHEKLGEQLMFDGKTTGEQAAVQMVAAEKALKEAALNKIKADMSQSVGNAPAPEKASVDNRPLEDKCKDEWEKSPELRKEFAENFGAYLAFMKHAEAGNVKIFGGRK